MSNDTPGAGRPVWVADVLARANTRRLPGMLWGGGRIGAGPERMCQVSLDVYLHLAGAPPRASSGIFVREDGATRELTRAEWDARFPGREPFVANATDESDTTVYDANITHNLSRMADDAGLYYPLWRPEEIGITKAAQLVAPLAAGLNLLLADPNRFKALNPANGWGTYEGLVEFVTAYANACARYPDADISVSR